MKSESENLLENLRGNFFSKALSAKITLKLNWNNTDSILNLNQTYSDLIHADLNHTDSNQPIQENPTNIRSIHYSANIHAIENILASPVHYPVHASPIFICGSASDPTSPPHDSLVENVTPKGKRKKYQIMNIFHAYIDAHSQI